MRRAGGSRKMMGWVLVPCTRKIKSKNTEARMEIEEILKMKLATITEEAEEPALAETTTTAAIDQENGGGGILMTTTTAKNKHRWLYKNHHLIKVKMARFFIMPEFSLKESYLIFMTGLACKGGLHGLPRC